MGMDRTPRAGRISRLAPLALAVLGALFIGAIGLAYLFAPSAKNAASCSTMTS